MQRPNYPDLVVIPLRLSRRSTESRYIDSVHVKLSSAEPPEPFRLTSGTEIVRTVKSMLNVSCGLAIENLRRADYYFASKRSGSHRLSIIGQREPEVPYECTMAWSKPLRVHIKVSRSKVLMSLAVGSVSPIPDLTASDYGDQGILHTSFPTPVLINGSTRCVK
jgi:hypothetical protein